MSPAHFTPAPRSEVKTVLVYEVSVVNDTGDRIVEYHYCPGRALASAFDWVVHDWDLEGMFEHEKLQGVWNSSGPPFSPPRNPPGNRT